MMGKNKVFSLPRIITFTFLGGSILAYLLLPDFRTWLTEAFKVFSTGNEQSIQSWMDQYGNISLLILLGLYIFQMFLFVVPSIVVMSLSIIMYGPWWGSLICLGGIFLASSIAFFIGHSLSTVTVDKMVGKSSREKMQEFLEDYGFWTVFIFRLSAFLSNDAVSFVAGLVRMNYWRFILATIAGIAPLTALLAWIGTSQSGQIKTGLIIAGAVSLIGFGVFIYVDRRRKKRHSESKANDK